MKALSFALTWASRLLLFANKKFSGELSVVVWHAVFSLIFCIFCYKV